MGSHFAGPELGHTGRDYLAYAPFSRQGLIGQLVYEGFSYGQAEYGAAAVGC